MTKSILTQAVLKEHFEYDPATGLFTWVRRSGGRSSVGAAAGRTLQTGHVQIGFRGKQYLAHRIAFLYMTGTLPPEEVDHINHQAGDNRWVNLRLVSHKENMQNTRRSTRNRSGAVGVCWLEERGRWLASVNREYLGLFVDFDDAVAARKAAERDLGFHKNHGM